jgi:hypothetical protein
VNIYSEDTSWASFSCTGAVTVIVKSLDNEPIRSCDIYPSRLGITPVVNGCEVEFELTSPAKLSVELNGQIIHPLLLFADAVEEEPIPEPGPDVLIFAPGFHEAGMIPLHSGQTVYLAEGAYVKGYFESVKNMENVTIRGRGIISGEAYEHKAHHMIEIMGASRNIRIEGITIVNSPWTHIRMWGRNNTVRNVKMISWYYNTDGILLGEQSLIEDCFFKCNDDAIKLYHSDIVVRRCVIWQLMNGAPFQLTWNVSVPTGRVSVTDCDVIRVEHYKDWDNRGVFNCIHGGTGHLMGYLFEDIRIENANFRFVKLIFQKSKFNIEQIGFGHISDVTFRNITMKDEMKERNILKGHDAEHAIRSITFDNVVMNGQPIDRDEFILDPESVFDIKVVSP